MRYLGTNFSLTLGGLRIRVRIDLDDGEELEERRPAAGPTFARSVKATSFVRQQGARSEGRTA